MHLGFALLTLLLAAVSASPKFNSRPFSAVYSKRQASPDPLTVDLGYEVYQGTSNSTNGLNSWLGYAFHCTS